MENFILFLFSLNRQFIALILFILWAACHQNQLEIDVSSVKLPLSDTTILEFLSNFA